MMVFSLVAMIGLEKCCITSAYLQWLCHSGEQVVAHGPLVYFYFFCCFFFFALAICFYFFRQGHLCPFDTFLDFTQEAFLKI